MLNLLSAKDPMEYLESSDSWITKSKSSAKFKPVHDYIEDLDEIPFFDYEICDFEKHASNQVAASSFHNVEDKRGFHVMTSEGALIYVHFVPHIKHMDENALPLNREG